MTIKPFVEWAVEYPSGRTRFPVVGSVSHPDYEPIFMTFEWPDPPDDIEQVSRGIEMAGEMRFAQRMAEGTLVPRHS